MDKSSKPAKNNYFKQFFLLFNTVLGRVKTGIGWKNISIILIAAGFLLLPFSIFKTFNMIRADWDVPVFNKAVSEKRSKDFILQLEKSQDLNGDLIFLQENSLLAISYPIHLETEVGRKIEVVITAYSSTPWETSDDPYITAAGTLVRDGVVANNYLSFGTKLKIPEIFGEKIFVVEDRMHWRKSKNHIDIWFPSHWQALNFGVKKSYIEILDI